MSVLDRIAHASAWRHRSSTAKLVLCLGLMGVALGGPEPVAAVLVFAATGLLAVVAARLPLRVFTAVLVAPIGFLVTSLPVLALTVSWQDGPVIGWSPDGAMAGLMLMPRSLAAVSALALLALTTPASRLVGVLRRWGLPAAVADLALLIYRVLFVLGETAAGGARAQAARLGYHGWRRSLRSLSLLTAGLFVRAMERARRMELGLQARGYVDTLPVVQVEPSTSGREWVVAVGLPAVLLMGSFLMQWSWRGLAG